MLIDVALPLSLAFIMFSLGLGLTFADFGRVFAMPRAVLVGIVGQVLLLPVLAMLMVGLFDLPPALAFGFLLLSFCPGGVSSNFLTKLGGGNVALSITLTGVVSLMSVVTVPILSGWAASRFLADAALQINVTGIAMAMFAITAVPVLIGLMLRFIAPERMERIEPTISTIALILFVIIVVAALATNWALFIEYIGRLGLLLISFNAILLLVGYGLARLTGLSGSDGICIAIEMGVQNAALGITVAGLVAQSVGISEYAIPAAVYGITMYLVSIPGMFVLRAVFGGDN